MLGGPGGGPLQELPRDPSEIPSITEPRDERGEDYGRGGRERGERYERNRRDDQGERYGRRGRDDRDGGMMGRGMMRRGMMAPAQMGAGMMGTAMMRMMLMLMDTDGDGTVSLSEFQAAHERMFKALDAKKDGKLTLQEVQAFFQGQNASMAPGTDHRKAIAPRRTRSLCGRTKTRRTRLTSSVKFPWLRLRRPARLGHSCDPLTM